MIHVPGLWTLPNDVIAERENEKKEEEKKGIAEARERKMQKKNRKISGSCEENVGLKLCSGPCRVDFHESTSENVSFNSFFIH